jgi:E3 ubiquitin-protein ligase SIAH1
LPITGRIFQCSEGHTLCSTCYVKVSNQCPVCRVKLSHINSHTRTNSTSTTTSTTTTSNGGIVPIRCLSLEKLTSQLYVTCSFASSGCNAEIRYNERILHESLCIYRDLPCIASIMSSRFADCQWTGPLTQAIAHVTTAHRSITSPVIFLHHPILPSLILSTI